jgi:hypothetical protein
MTSGPPEARRAQCRVGSPVARPIPRGLLWGSAREGRGHGEFFGLSIAECYFKPTTHAPCERGRVHPRRFPRAGAGVGPVL